jgi:hypothetical protein
MKLYRHLNKMLSKLKNNFKSYRKGSEFHQSFIFIKKVTFKTIKKALLFSIERL